LARFARSVHVPAHTAVSVGDRALGVGQTEQLVWYARQALEAEIVAVVEIC
jgi:hypothetical protein